MRAVLFVFITTFIAACTSISTKPVDFTHHKVSHICIQENAKVIVSDFLPVVRSQIEQHGLTTELYTSDAPPPHCEYTLTYTARQSWDFATYLSFAELELRRGAELVSKGHFHLRNKGGYALNKWRSTESKMKPVIDQMLVGLPISAGHT